MKKPDKFYLINGLQWKSFRGEMNLKEALEAEEDFDDIEMDTDEERVNWVMNKKGTLSVVPNKELYFIENQETRAMQNLPEELYPLLEVELYQVLDEEEYDETGNADYEFYAEALISSKKFAAFIQGENFDELKEKMLKGYKLKKSFAPEQTEKELMELVWEKYLEPAQNSLAMELAGGEESLFLEITELCTQEIEEEE